MRYCERVLYNEHTGETKYIPYDFKNLREGDCFRLFEEKDNPLTIVLDKDGFSVWKAMSDAYENDEGIWQIDITDSING
jgi:hypothetical protein